MPGSVNNERRTPRGLNERAVQQRSNKAGDLPSDAERPTLFPGTLIGISLVLLVAINVGPYNISPIDAAMALIAVGYIPLILGVKNLEFARVAFAVGLPMATYLFVGLLLLTLVGGFWLGLFKDAVSFSYLFITMAVLMKCRRRVNMTPVFLGLYAAILILFAVTMASSSMRATGFSVNPNSPAILLAGAAVVMAITGRPRNVYLRVLMIVIAFVSILQTGSLGAVAAMMAGLIFYGLSRSGMSTPAQILSGLVGVLLAFLALPLVSQFTRFSRETGVDRMERSQNARFDIWTHAFETWMENPLGVGPGGYSKSAGLFNPVRIPEAHNDYVGVLVELGLIGLIILLWIFASMFFISAAARPLVVVAATFAATHSSLNMRSNWILFAIVVAWAYWEKADRSTVTQPMAHTQRPSLLPSVGVTGGQPQGSVPRPYGALPSKLGPDPSWKKGFSALEAPS